MHFFATIAVLSTISTDRLTSYNALNKNGRKESACESQLQFVGTGLICMIVYY